MMPADLMPLIDCDHWDAPALATAYKTNRPFSHVVIDDFLRPEVVGDLARAFDEEPAHQLQDEIFDVMASGGDFEHPSFRALADALRSEPVLRAIGVLTGETLSGVEVRAYAYLPGHYLLPHADRDDGGRRRVAFAYYVACLDELTGGELDLYACELSVDEIVKTAVTTTIAPRANRCVLFAVGPHSLHRVREVIAGARLSLAGWFLA